MHCDKCGSFLDSDSRFCKTCGASVHDPEETRIARPQSSVPNRSDEGDDIESVVFRVCPTMFFIKIEYEASILSAILLTILLAMIKIMYIPWYVSLPIAMCLLLIPAYYHLKRNMILYTFTDSKIEIDYGLIARTTRNIPISKIQDVTVSASIWQRLLGFGDIVVDNASEIGGTTTLHNINNPRHYADLLLRQLPRGH